MKRHGFTLIELVVTLGCLLALGATSLTLLVMLNRSNASFASRRLHLTEMERLIEDFRESCRRNQTFVIERDGKTLRLKSGEQIEQFEMTGDSNELAFQSQANGAAKPSRQDRYRLQSTARLRFAKSDEVDSMVQLWIETSQPKGQALMVLGKVAKSSNETQP